MTLLRGCLIALLLLGSAAMAWAGKGGSSSSGGVRSSGGGVRSSGGGKSYSSGSRPSSSSFKPSSSSYKPSSSSSKPPSSSYKPPSSSSKPSSGSSSKPSTGSTFNPFKPSPGASSNKSPGTSSGGRKYSSGTTTVPRGSGYSSGQTAYDSAAAEAQRRSESRAAFRPGAQPRPSYNDTKGQSRPIDPSDRRVETVRRTVTADRWYDRPTRIQTIYRDVSPRPVVVYQDPYNNWFWWWMLSRDLDYRASWAYHHRDSMDRLRYRDLLEHDRALEARIRELEAKGTPRDPAFVPAGLDADLMYTDEYVGAVVNPIDTSAAPAHSSPESSGFFSLVRFVVVAGIVALLVWLVFFKRWGV